MMCTCRRAAVIGGLLAAAQAMAAPEEIQVYLDDKEEAGGVSLDFHLNEVPSGRRQPAYAGEQAPGGVFRLTPELNWGLTDTLELGGYVLTSHDAPTGWHVDGVKARLKYIAPHDPARGGFWGANLELGRLSTRVSQSAWTAQLKLIGGWRTADWTCGANVNLDRGLSASGGPTTVEVDLTALRTIDGKTRVGLELYGDLGPLRRVSGWSRESKTLFAVLEAPLLGADLNLGIGRGLTDPADRWVLKLIIATHFF